MKQVSKELSKELIKKQKITKPVATQGFNRVENFAATAHSFAKSDTLESSEQKSENKIEFRMLSNSMVAGVYDFEKVDFEKYVDLFSNVKLMKDHSHKIDAIIGKTGKAYFDKESKVKGVNAEIFIDEEFGAVEKKKVEKGLIDSGSVTVKFTSQPSHEFEDPWDFYMLLGTEIDGEMVRFVVDEVQEISEFSLVWAGADPNAKRLSQDLFQLEEMVEKLKISEASLESKRVDYKKLEASFQEVLASNEQLTKNLIEQKTKIVEFERQVAELKDKAAIGDTYILDLKAKAKNALARTQKPSPVLLNSIELSQDPEFLSELIASFNAICDSLPFGRVSVSKENNDLFESELKRTLKPVKED